MAHPAPVFAGSIQALVCSVFDCPILARQLEQPGGAGFLRREACDQPDGFNFLPAAFEFPDAVQPCHLRHKGETNLLRGDGDDFDAPPFDSPMPLFNLQKLRGKNLPEGSVLLWPELRPGCL